MINNCKLISHYSETSVLSLVILKGNDNFAIRIDRIGSNFITGRPILRDL